jgi:hypothetical protein
MDKIENMICKSASLKAMETTEDDIAKINQYTLSPLTAEDVFVFKAMFADNEQDDRNYEPFNLKSIEDLAKLYVGKVVMMNHKEDQCGRVFDTEVVKSNTVTELGEQHAELIAKIYIPITDKNQKLIEDIKYGILKEVSTNCKPAKVICNICGKDNKESYCCHWVGRKYVVGDEKVTCKMLIDGVEEAYEVSFVPTPAQPRAGVCKAKEEKLEKKQSEIKARIRLAEITNHKIKENDI